MNTDMKSVHISFFGSFFCIFVLFCLAVLNGCAVSAENGAVIKVSNINTEKGVVGPEERYQMDISEMADLADEKKRLTIMRSIKRGDYVILSGGDVYLASNSFSEENESIKLWRPGLFSPFKLELKDAEKIEKVVKSGTDEYRKLFLSFI